MVTMSSHTPEEQASPCRSSSTNMFHTYTSTTSTVPSSLFGTASLTTQMHSAIASKPRRSLYPHGGDNVRCRQAHANPASSSLDLLRFISIGQTAPES